MTTQFKKQGKEIFKKYKKLINISFIFYKFTPAFIRPLYKKIFYISIFQKLFNYYDVRLKAKSLGENIYISDFVIIKNHQNLSIGSNFSLHEFSYIDAAGHIEIGDNVSIAHNCSIISFEHTWDEPKTPIKYNPTKIGKVVIGKDVWIGCGVRILSNSSIEDRVVVAAGSVVKGNLESGYLYGGIPAKRLKKL